MIGILMPCNILVIDNEYNTSKIAFPIAKSQLKLTGNQDSIKLSERVDSLLISAFESIN